MLASILMRILLDSTMPGDVFVQAVASTEPIGACPDVAWQGVGGVSGVGANEVRGPTKSKTAVHKSSSNSHSR